MPGHRSWRSSGRRPARSAFLHKLRRWPQKTPKNLAGGRLTSRILRAVNKEFELKLASQYFATSCPFNAELYTAQSNEARDGDHQAATAQTLSHADSIYPTGCASFSPSVTTLSASPSPSRSARTTWPIPPSRLFAGRAPTYWGIYRWPVNSYARYAEIENLEDTGTRLCTGTPDTPSTTSRLRLRNVSYGSLQLPEQRPRRTAVQGRTYASPGADDRHATAHQDPLPEVTRPAPNPDVRRLTILQQPLIQSYVIAILDHSRASRFSSLTSLTIAKIPSSHINMFQRHDLWDRDDHLASPSCHWVFVLLSEYISHRRNITFFHFEWICGGEFAPGVYQRNNYVLPAPFCHPTAMFEPHTAISVPTTAMDDTQPAFQPAVVFGSVAVAAANQVAIPTLSRGPGSEPAGSRTTKASGPRLRHWLPEGDSFRRERKSGLYKLKSISFKSEEPWADHDVAMRRKELENFMQVCGDHGIAKIVNMLSSDDETHFGTTWNMTQGWTGRGRFSGFVTVPGLRFQLG
ncbi:hypothetical protein EV126DRAFT_435007, partial [Verticillium dahliae]